jgi:DNA polymerase III epsilon subunit-like protein
MTEQECKQIREQCFNRTAKREDVISTFAYIKEEIDAAIVDLNDILETSSLETFEGYGAVLDAEAALRNLIHQIGTLRSGLVYLDNVEQYR